MQSVLELVRGVTRPLLTLIWLLATVVYLWFGIAPPDAWWALGVVMIGWWFYDRYRQNQGPAATPSVNLSVLPTTREPLVYVDGVLYQPTNGTVSAELASKTTPTEAVGANSLAVP